MRKSILVLLTIIYFITLGTILFFFRYSIIPTHGGLYPSYKLNRLTGEVTVLFGSREVAMRVSEKKADLSFLPDKPKSESGNPFADLVPDKKSKGLAIEGSIPDKPKFRPLPPGEETQVKTTEELFGGRKVEKPAVTAEKPTPK